MQKGTGLFGSNLHFGYWAGSAATSAKLLSAVDKKCSTGVFQLSRFTWFMRMLQQYCRSQRLERALLEEAAAVTYTCACAWAFQTPMR